MATPGSSAAVVPALAGAQAAAQDPLKASLATLTSSSTYALTTSALRTRLEAALAATETPVPALLPQLTEFVSELWQRVGAAEEEKELALRLLLRFDEVVRPNLDGDAALGWDALLAGVDGDDQFVDVGEGEAQVGAQGAKGKGKEKERAPRIGRWRSAAQDAQGAYDTQVEQAIKMIETHSPWASLDDVPWGSIGWSHSLSAQKARTSAIRFATHSNSYGNPLLPRPSPAKVEARFLEAVARAAQLAVKKDYYNWWLSARLRLSERGSLLFIPPRFTPPPLQ